MKRVKRAYFEVPDAFEGLGVPLNNCRVIWSDLDANNIPPRKGYHYVPRTQDSWHYETRDFNEAMDYFKKNPPLHTLENPFLNRFSPHEFRLLDIRGSVGDPKDCTVILSGGRFEKFCFA